MADSRLGGPKAAGGLEFILFHLDISTHFHTLYTPLELIIYDDGGMQAVSAINIYSSPEKQLEKWRELNEWVKKSFPKEAIPEEAFKAIEPKLKGLTAKSRLFYGFGDNGKGGADPFLTGHMFSNYLVSKYPNERSRYVDFYPSPPDPARFDFYRPKIKMREGAAERPKGFYIKELLPKDFEEAIGKTHQQLSPADVRKLSPWGWGPEGFQFLAIEDVYTKLLIDEKAPFFVLGDYAISPYGGDDFASCVILGPLRGRLEIGVTNSRDNIPKYAPSHFA